MNKPNILLVGAGAVGSTVAAWLAPHNKNFYVFDRPQVLDRLKNVGMTAYLQLHAEKNGNEGGGAAPEKPASSKPASEKTVSEKSVPLKVVYRLEDCPTPDIILLCVKNYSLRSLSRLLVDAFGADELSDTIVVGLQNGVANQEILPDYFSNLVYGIVSFNAWLDSPGVVGYQSKGPFLFGTPDNDNQKAVQSVVDLFNAGVPAIYSEHFQDAALCKMIINLTNSLTTLAGVGFREIDDMSLFQKLLSRQLYEGIKIVSAAGYRECKVGGAPAWLLIKASALLPQKLTSVLFRRNVKKMVLSSMAQDVLQNARGQNELEDINGHLLALAHRYKVDAPYNEAIYSICRQEFARDSFEPLSFSNIWQRMQT
ncbi:ketopantoate reductase family protein [Aliikangiella sp. G2MR2-5]|uniref:ketopantoate reductase family protein n=1 Tax=Aliikangiella sp. G2MR2-5 TaxID=2788943 RepID=UPI0018AA99BF|nr:ketopantoate reductase family protein [Aliikangiella sp. G2MR2-5]